MNSQIARALKFEDTRAPLKVAMVGGGINSAIGRVHEIAMKMDRRFELVSGCFSRDSAINKKSASQYGVDQQRTYPSLTSLLKEEAHEISAVVIATPIQSHFDQILKSLNGGVRVISDKPLVANPEQCRIIRREAEKLQIEVYCIYNYTGYPAVREMRRLVKEGAIGTVFKVMAEMPQDSYMRLVNQNRVSEIQSWRLIDEEIACVTLDLFVHIHSLVAFICEGRVSQVRAFPRCVSGASNGLIDEVDVFARYDNGMSLNAWYGKAAFGYRNGLSLRLFGTRGSLHWQQVDPEKLHFVDSAGNHASIDRLTSGENVWSLPRYQRFKAGHPAGFIEAFANYYYDIAESIETGCHSPLLLPLETVEEGLIMCAEIHNPTSFG